jgi:nucleoside-diphosphate-sugar epimerase
MARRRWAVTVVTGAAGFMNIELIEILVALGHRVLGVVRDPAGAERVRRAGAAAIVGDLLKPGRLQGETPADAPRSRECHRLTGAPHRLPGGDRRRSEYSNESSDYMSVWTRLRFRGATM